MTNNTYMVVETTNLANSVAFSLQATSDIQNGSIVGKGDLISGETSIYAALTDYDNSMYLVANPAWSYENFRATDKNEENFTNVAGIPFRAYRLGKDMKYKIYNNINTEFVVGDYLTFEDGAYNKSNDPTSLKVVNIEDIGFPYCIGSEGIQNGEYGYTVGEKVKKYTIEVLA